MVNETKELQICHHLPDGATRLATCRVSGLPCYSLVAVLCMLVQLWKRSGAWFYRGLPQYVRPAPKKPVQNSSVRIFAVSPASSKSSSYQSPNQSTRRTYGGWSRSSATRLLISLSSVYLSDWNLLMLKIAIWSQHFIYRMTCKN